MKIINEYKNRFNQLMESTMGDVRPLISEVETNVIDLTDLNSQVPDSLVDSPPETTLAGTYTSNGRDGSITLCFGTTCFKVPGANLKFNYNPGTGRAEAGQIQGVRNSFFFKPYVVDGKTYNVKWYLGNQLATEVVNNSKDKLIGFGNDSINFFCYVPKTGGGYVCDKFSYEDS